jgi:hypothetical protein
MLPRGASKPNLFLQKISIFPGLQGAKDLSSKGFMDFIESQNLVGQSLQLVSVVLGTA